MRCERGLSEQTIRHFDLGYYPLGGFGFTHDKDIARWGPELKGQRWVTIPPGIVIPCRENDTIWYVKSRCPHLDSKSGSLDTLSAYLDYTWSWQKDGETVYCTAKYVNVSGSQAKALFGADDLRGEGQDLLLCEGEFDMMLAWQVLRDLTDVASLGGASMGSGGISPRWLMRLLPYRRILVAYDVDSNHAGDEGAAVLATLSKRVKRIKVPYGGDLTGFWKAGGDLRAWLALQQVMLTK